MQDMWAPCRDISCPFSDLRPESNLARQIDNVRLLSLVLRNIILRLLLSYLFSKSKEIQQNLPRSLLIEVTPGTFLLKTGFAQSW